MEDNIHVWYEKIKKPNQFFTPDDDCELTNNLWLGEACFCQAKWDSSALLVESICFCSRR